MSIDMTNSSSRQPVLGVFAIQGAVEEHANCVRKCGGIVKEIRLPKDFEGLDGIILPGGESTTMAIIGERWGLFPKLKDWVAAKKPIWGTCAGMILLSDHAIKQARGGQTLVGGLDVHVCRNFFGSQIHSCQVDITIDSNGPNGISGPSSETDPNCILCSSSGILGPGSGKDKKCPAVFIRAPAILSIGPDVDVLARIIAKPHQSARADVLKLLDAAKEKEHSIATVIESISEIMLNSQPRSKRQRLSKSIPDFDTVNGDNYVNMDNGEGGNGSGGNGGNGAGESSFEVFVAVRQGHILATAFHPELTDDLRWHKYFMEMVHKSMETVTN